MKISRIGYWCVLTVACILLLSGCEKEEVKPVPPPPSRLSFSQENQEVIDSANKLGFVLLDKADDRHNNVVMSPLGITQTMAILANGADSETRQEILKLLGNPDIQTLNTTYNILSGWQRNPETQDVFNTANSIWLNNGISVNDDFKQIVSSIYQAEIFSTDLNANSSKEEINNWCSAHTDGSLGSVFSQAPGGDLNLISTVCYNGKWDYTYSDIRIPFHNASGADTDITMMKYELDHNAYYTYCDTWESVQLDYADYLFCLEIILPKEGYTPEDVLAALKKGETDDNRMESLRPGFVTMPGFSVSQTTDFSDIIKELGVDLAFSPMADFSNMTASPLSVNGVMQSSSFKTDKAGTSVSSAAIQKLGTRYQSYQLDLIVNRPFIFFVKAKGSDLILMSGIIRNL